MNFREHVKKKIQDIEYVSDVESEDLTRMEFSRVYAVKITFTDVSFKQSTFSSCYFKNCRFIRCDFTGAHFKECYLKGSNFPDSNLKYVTLEKTLIEENVLECCLPPEENIARDLVRSLRVNFIQVGNYEAANQAAAIEVKLTERHLYNAAYSRQAYYRSKDKYSGWNRLDFAYKHLKWKVLGYLWGNGESVSNVIYSGIIFILLISISVFSFTPNTFKDALILTLNEFWGIKNSNPLVFPYPLILTIGRFIWVGLFMSILIKRLAKR